MNDLTHFDKDGKARMVDVSEKQDTVREAVAKGKIIVNQAVFDAVVNGTMGKGDVLGVATTAGIMGVKRTADLIPMCHVLPITKCSVVFDLVPEKREIHCTCTVKVTGKTGVEMEALTGVNVALLTVYDMCKALDKTMEISDIYLYKKTGGKSGEIVNERGQIYESEMLDVTEECPAAAQVCAIEKAQEGCCVEQSGKMMVQSEELLMKSYRINSKSGDSVLGEIKNSLLFKNMDVQRVDVIIQRLGGRCKSYTKNQFIISEEMQVDEIGILLSGELCKVQYFADGTEQMVQKLMPSYMVGLEIAISKKKTSPYSVYAAQDAEIYWFPAKYIEKAGILKEEDRIDLYQRIIQFLASDDIRKYRKIEILLCKGAREKIEKYLKIQKIKYGSSEFQIEFDREQLANYLGMNRTVLSHELKKMEQEGLLKVKKNHFVLLDKME